MNKKLIENIQLPKIFDPRGSLTVAEEGIHIPFRIEKVEWINFGMSNLTNDCPTNETPNSKDLTTTGKLMLVALAGQIFLRVTSMEGKTEECTLSTPYQVVVVREACQMSIDSHTANAVLLKISGECNEQENHHNRRYDSEPRIIKR